MVGRRITRLIIAFAVVAFAMPLAAGEIGEFFSSVARDFKRRNCWPEPFVHADRATVGQMIAVQTSAGWERQNLLAEFHFLPGGTELTEAGRMRIQWIMNDAPESHRQIYVRRANNPQETASRMETVQRLVAQSPYAANIPVIESTRIDDGWPADRIDWLSRKATAAAVEPKLMGAPTTGTGGGGH